MKRYYVEEYGRHEGTPDHCSLNVHEDGSPQDGCLVDYLSPAEAHIIAFALNAVAEDYKLLAYRSNGEYGGGEGLTIHRPFERYTGPTEGVAP